MAKAEQKIIDRMEEAYQELLNTRAEGKKYNKVFYKDEGIAKIRSIINSLSRKQIVETKCYGVYLFFKEIKGVKIIENEFSWTMEA